MIKAIFPIEDIVGRIFPPFSVDILKIDYHYVKQTSMSIHPGMPILLIRKIAIKNLAILQTCVRLRRMPAILRYRRIFAPHRIGDIRLVAKMASASSDRQLAGFPKNQSLFLG
ncbi:MAG: hypothetical protein A3G39_09160 [Deltaproteobacteria bacterium RIFCSPLOWO2_12_FULL_43_16]|nr:MAG: hypothetical protein A2Z89_05445 [Deltaproteobacteria bacterium GWA2_43_19]OGQ12571.1 MAG: hypothetical protein A3D30_10585 [Deltaproteobacteria bacterium RIFCSPHIGHO2_02_FULL_43_33]OGQ56843.1 MAG: hypothetical protein A3G39_09160 [Deltaproteobacteria bacterium RIFCSPLOWO2_12_FULL_43_16]